MTLGAEVHFQVGSPLRRILNECGIVFQISVSTILLAADVVSELFDANDAAVQFDESPGT